MNRFYFALSLLFILLSASLRADSEDEPDEEAVHPFSMRALSAKMEDDFERSGRLVRSAGLELYFDSVAQELRLPSDLQGEEVRVRLLKSRSFNAFAAANGTLFLCTGILSRLENEDQLAALLSHEMTHVLRQHALRNLQETKQAARDNAASRSSLNLLFGDLGDWISNVSLVAAVTGYSKDTEREADSIGLLRMRKAGYSLVEFRGLFMKLKRHIQDEKINEPFFFSTHPRLAERIDNYNRIVGSDSVQQVHRPALPGVFNARIRDILLYEASSCLDAGKLAVTRNLASKVAAIDSCPVAAFLLLGDTEQKGGSDTLGTRTLSWYEKAVGCDTAGGQSVMKLGMFYYSQGRYPEAAEKLGGFLSRNPVSPYRPMLEKYLLRCSQK